MVVALVFVILATLFVICWFAAFDRARAVTIELRVVFNQAAVVVLRVMVISPVPSPNVGRALWRLLDARARGARTLTAITVGAIGRKHGALGRGVAVNIGRHYGAHGLREVFACRRCDTRARDARTLTEP